MKSKHSIDRDTLNSDIEYCISEYVRIEAHRDILREHWFRGCTFDELSAKYNLSLSSIKSVIYNIGDDILVRASERGQKTV